MKTTGRTPGNFRGLEGVYYSNLKIASLVYRFWIGLNVLRSLTT